MSKDSKYIDIRAEDIGRTPRKKRSPLTQGKGDGNHTSDFNAFRTNYDKIDWSKE